MGQVAAALGVTPGTATTMVKALAESGLAEYEPYSGVRLTRRGRKARRPRAAPPSPRRAVPRAGDGHELGRSARRSRAARTRRLRTADRAHRRDARPSDARSARRSDSRTRTARSRAAHLDSLLTCPIGTPLKVTRIADQDPAFLRFIESNDLKPGQPIEVEARDAAADSVRAPRQGPPAITIGARAASKLLVEVDPRLSAALRRHAARVACRAVRLRVCAATLRAQTLARDADQPRSSRRHQQSAAGRTGLRPDRVGRDPDAAGRGAPRVRLADRGADRRARLARGAGRQRRAADSDRHG